RDNDLGKRGSLWCPGDVGGTNINGPSAGDPETGILYVTSVSACTTRVIVPGEEADLRYMTDGGTTTTGTTIAQYAVGVGGGGPRGPGGLPLFKPPYSRITAIDLNTGEHLWMIPVGETPDRIRNNPALEGIDVGNTGTGAHALMAVTKNMLMYASQSSDGTPTLFAVDKMTGEQLGKVEVSSNTRYGMMTYVHEGEQYVVLQTGSTLTALSLNGPVSAGGGGHRFRGYPVTKKPGRELCPGFFFACGCRLGSRKTVLTIREGIAMIPRIAINGFGRIGRTVMRIAKLRGHYDVVAINDLADADQLAYA